MYPGTEGKNGMKAKRMVVLAGVLFFSAICTNGGCGRIGTDSYGSAKLTTESQGIADTELESETDNSQNESNSQNSETSLLQEADIQKIKEEGKQETADSTVKADPKALNPKAVVKEGSVYNCDLEADRAAYDGHVDIIVGDNLYATQINDWHMNFDQYSGKVVEIEGYYVGDFAPYDFVGRFGPSCPYCQGGYVSFEILTDVDVSKLESGKDWIKVTGILREGDDASGTKFCYIEALKLEKMDSAGQDTVTN